VARADDWAATDLPASLRRILVLEPMVPFTLSLMEQGYSGSNPLYGRRAVERPSSEPPHLRPPLFG